MKILVAHNSYQQRGGEDSVFEQQSAMLTAAGHDVKRFSVGNDHIKGFARKIAAAFSIISNQSSITAICAEVDAFAPDIVHIHNFFPTLSPAAIAAVAKKNIPVVLTLHNYRLICPGAMLLRGGKPCEDCVGHTKLPGIRHGCYRGSRLGSAAVGAMGWYFKNLLKEYPRHLTMIALTEFAKSRFAADGFPKEQMVVRGNVMPDPGLGPRERESRIVFVGRLSPEKGVDTLIRAASHVNGQIEIIGDGPERARLESMAPHNVIFRGHFSAPQVLDRIKSATALAVPSRWYEGFPMVILEAMATGTPVIASRLGSLAEIVEHGKTGLLVSADNSAAWATALNNLLQQPEQARLLGLEARTQFLQRHSEKAGVASLLEIYDKAIAQIRP